MHKEDSQYHQPHYFLDTKLQVHNQMRLYKDIYEKSAVWWSSQLTPKLVPIQKGMLYLTVQDSKLVQEEI